MPDTTKTVLIAGFFGLLGTGLGGAITGWSSVELAKQKFNSDLVMKALESPSPEARLATLRLLVDTHLIEDQAIRSAVSNYTSEKKTNPGSIPQVQPSNSSLAPPLLENNRIFILAGSAETSSKFSGILTDLAKAGYSVIGAKPLNDKERPNSPEIRYFNAIDKTQSERLAVFLGEKLQLATVATKQYDDASAKPGYIEIWLGR